MQARLIGKLACQDSIKLRHFRIVAFNMKFKLRPFPHLVKYVDKIETKSHSAYVEMTGATNGPLIRIKTNAPDHVYQHELEHVRQWYMSLFLHGWIYILCKKYRLWAELSAYRKSVDAGRSAQDAARSLADEHYGLDLTVADAERLLSEKQIGQ